MAYKPKALKKVGSPSDFPKFQDNVQVKLDEYDRLPFWGGNTLEIQVGGSPTSFEHRLGRVPSGFIVFYLDNNVTVWSQGEDDKFITLEASGTANIKVWVF